VWSGQALNHLTQHLLTPSGDPHFKPGGARVGDADKKSDGKLETALDVQLVERLRFRSTKGEDGRLLGYESNIRWPEFLKTEGFNEPRQRVEHLFAQTVQEARCKERVDAQKVKDLRGQLQKMGETLRNVVGDITPTEYIESRRFLNILEDGARLLDDPNVGRHVVVLRVKARTVRELLQNMSRQALQFAPASPGDEEAYLQLYRILEKCQPEPARQTGRD
jgi:hypothetical protein